MRPSRLLRTMLHWLIPALALVTAGVRGADKIPVTSGSKEALAEFIEGRTLFDNLRLTDAVPYFQKAIDKDAGFALAHLYLAQSAPTAKVFFAELNKADEASAKASKGEQLYIKAFKAGSYADQSTSLKLYKELVEAFPERRACANASRHDIFSHSRTTCRRRST